MNGTGGYFSKLRDCGDGGEVVVVDEEDGCRKEVCWRQEAGGSSIDADGLVIFGPTGSESETARSGYLVTSSDTFEFES